MKNFICCHVIAVAVRKRLHEFDERARQIPVGQNRKRGRPRNTVAALRRQPGEGPQQDMNKDLSDVEEEAEEDSDETVIDESSSTEEAEVPQPQLRGSKRMLK